MNYLRLFFITCFFVIGLALTVNDLYVYISGTPLYGSHRSVYTVSVLIALISVAYRVFAGAKNKA